MIKQSMMFNDILEKKFKILRTSIMLGNLRNREATLKEYEETARDVDKLRTSVYEEILGAKLYTTVTLDEEKDRLKDLISFIERRIDERNDFVDDYIKITSNFLDGLDKISLENDLPSYRLRYNNIDEYLNNCDEIKILNSKLIELRDELEEKYENKANNEIINSNLEDELIDEFNNFISRSTYYSELNYTDIDSELSKIEESMIEKKGVLDTFTSSYQALVNAGISGAEREEYSSYVQEARLNYYEDIEKKCILNIYKLVLDKQVDYDRLYEKRLNIENIISERKVFRDDLGVTRRDELEFFDDLCREQFGIIKSQKFNIENIDKLILDISTCENRLSDLENANSRAEILELVEEYSVEVPEIEKIELPDEKVVFEEIEKTLEKKPSNMVVKVKEPIKIDVKNASDTAKLVMKKVVIVLEPKKFNNKRDKLKEAELELEQEKLINEKNVDNSNLSNDIIPDLFDDGNVVGDEQPKNIEIMDELNVQEDIFLDNGSDKVKIEFDSNEIFNDLDNIEEVNIPTEIVVEEPVEEKELDLFETADPFLDDNEFELADIEEKTDVKSVMPSLDRIGTVKPNSSLSKIEDVVKNSDDIILPNLGLVDGANKEILLVNENYLN